MIVLILMWQLALGEVVQQAHDWNNATSRLDLQLHQLQRNV